MLILRIMKQVVSHGTYKTGNLILNQMCTELWEFHLLTAKIQFYFIVLLLSRMIEFII